MEPDATTTRAGREVAGSTYEVAGATQRRVRETIANVGGYWQPLAGVTRLLEELGELAEGADSAGGQAKSEQVGRLSVADGLSLELADLWIITTALADQFLACVAEPGSFAVEREERCSLEALVAAAGQIARVLNYYDGPKVPRDPGELPSLQAAVERFHRLLECYAAAHKVDLAAAVDQKLGAIAIRDVGRFGQGGHDPSTAPCLGAFRAIQNAAGDQGADSERLWGAPASAWSQTAPDCGAAEIVPTLRSFARAAIPERLDGYVIQGPPFHSQQSLSAAVERLLEELSQRFSPGGWRGSLLGEGATLSSEIEGVSLSVDAFSSPCGASLPIAPAATFLLLRADCP